MEKQNIHISLGDYSKTLAKNLLKLRYEKGISQEKVAHAADMSTLTYQKLEKGEWGGEPTNPRLNTLVALSDFYGIPLTALFE